MRKGTEEENDVVRMRGVRKYLLNIDFLFFLLPISIDITYSRLISSE